MNVFWIVEIALAAAMLAFIVLLLRLAYASIPYDEWVAMHRENSGGTEKTSDKKVWKERPAELPDK